MQQIMQYVSIDSFLHRLNPLTKLVLVVLVAILAITSSSILSVSALVLVLFLIALASGLHKELLRQVPLLVSLTISLVLLTVLTMQAGPVVGTLIPVGVPLIGGMVPITIGAIQFGLLLSLRFFAMLFGFQLLVVSTQPHDLVHALLKMHMPADYALMFLIALRFIPSLQLEGQRIHEAQLARAYNPGRGFRGAMRTLTPIIIPLVSNALAKANVLGLTIDLRGYRNPKKTSLRDRSLRTVDYVAIVVMLIAAAGFLATTIFMQIP